MVRVVRVVVDKAALFRHLQEMAVMEPPILVEVVEVVERVRLLDQEVQA
jgi:hypothetical protein